MKTYLFSGFLCLMLVLTAEKAEGQDVLYRSDGTTLQIKIVAIKGSTIEYRFPGDTTGRVFYNSSAILDSLRYEQGATVTFIKHETRVRRLPANYIGVDLFDALFRNINISFERISASGNTGLTAELFINLNSDDFWGVYDYWWFTNNMYLNYDPFSFLARVGISYYPFDFNLNKTGAVRVFTGGSVNMGQFRKSDMSEPYYIEEISNKLAFIISWNLGTKIFLSDNVQIKAAVDLSIIPFLVFNSPELGIVFGF